MYHLNNIFTVKGAYTKSKESSRGEIATKNSYLFRYLTAASFIFANTALALSSKGHGGGSGKNDEKVTAQLAEESAAVIAAQPKEVQEALVQNIAGYLAGQPEIGKKPGEIAALLHNKLAEIKTGLPRGMGMKWQHAVVHSSPSASPAI